MTPLGSDEAEIWRAAASRLNQDLQDYHFRRGELHSPSHDTGTFPYLRNNGHFSFVLRSFSQVN